MMEALAETVIARHRKRLHGRVRRITIDLDPTDDPTHGQQQLSFFNGHYDTYCYLPVVGFLTFNEEREQYLVTAVLRAGNAAGSLGAVGILSRLIPLLRKAFPKAVIRVRLDGGFAAPEVLDFLDGEPGLEYVVNMASNKVLDRRVEPDMVTARRLSQESGKTEHVYGEFLYKTEKTWPHERRIIYKAEVVRHPERDPKDNPRFVITNLKQKPQWIYEEVYCKRGDIENRIKLRPAKALELTVWQRRIDQTVRPIGRSLRGRSGEATDRSKPSDNVPTLARVAPEPRGDGVSASIRRRGARLGGKVRLHKCS